jgi:hypothetical protein
MEITYEDEEYNLKSPKYLFPVTSRRNEFGDFQLYDLDILRIMSEFIPKDAYCVLGIVHSLVPSFFFCSFDSYYRFRYLRMGRP